MRTCSHAVRPALATLALATIALAGAGVCPARAQGQWQGWPVSPLTDAAFLADGARDRLILVGGWTTQGASRVVWVRGLATDSSWRPVPFPPGAPAMVRRAGVAIDEPRGRLLVVGGLGAQSAGETWSLDLATLSSWTLLPTSGGPAVGGVSCDVDPGLGLLVAFAGSGLWTLDLGAAPAWTPVPAGPIPPEHYGSAYALDTARHRLVAQGGATADWSRMFGHMHRDVWTLDLVNPGSAAWTELAGVLGPFRAYHAGFYDAATDRFVGLGGQAGWLLPANDTWSLQLGSPYAFATLTNAPPNGPIALDPSESKLHVVSNSVLFTASLSGGGWLPNDVVSYPSLGKPHPQAVFDPRRHRMLIFGGGSRDEPSSDVWELPLGTLPRWQKLATSGAPPLARAGSATVLDVVHDRLIVHGGGTSTVDFTDTWALSLDGTPAWTQLGASASFAGPDAAATYDPAKDRMLIWTLPPSGPPARVMENRFDDGLGWRVLATTGTPPGSTAQQGSAFDPGRERWIVFGSGTVSAGDSHAGVWAFDLATDHWTELADLNAGLPWALAGGAFDVPGDRLAVFGGLRYVLNTTEAPTEVRVVEFGGAGGQYPLDLAPPIPAPRWSPWVVYDPWRDALVVAGGAEHSPDAPLFHDVWTLTWGRRHVKLLEAACGDSQLRVRWLVPGFEGRGLQLWRRTSVSGWAPHALLAVDDAGEAGFVDRTIAAGERYGYRLVDPAAVAVQPLDQAWVLATVNGAGVEPGDTDAGLLRIVNAPAIGRLRFRLHLDRAADVRCTLHDVQGRELRRWDMGVLGPGDHPVDGGDLPDLGAGVMYLRATAGPLSATRRFVFLR